MGKGLVALLLVLLIGVAQAQVVGDETGSVIIASLGLTPAECPVPEDMVPHIEQAWCGVGEFEGWDTFADRFNAAFDYLPVHHFTDWQVVTEGISLMDMTMWDSSYYVVSVARVPDGPLVVLITRIRETL